LKEAEEKGIKVNLQFIKDETMVDKIRVLAFAMGKG